MSRLNTGVAKPQGLNFVVSQLNTMMRQQGSALVSAEHTESVLSMESLNDARFNAVLAQHANLESQITRIWQEAFAGDRASMESLGDLSAAQVEAGAIVLGAAGNPAAYAEKAYRNLTASNKQGATVIESSANSFGVETYLEPSLEAFDEQELRNHLGWSVAFNVLGARQDEFSERFFPTVVVTPDQAGLDISIRRSMVLQEVRHSLTGQPLNFDQRNLIEAVIDHTILGSEANRIYPLVVSVGPEANVDKYVAAADVAPFNKVVEEGITVLTAPLKAGIDINLLGLSQRNDIQTQGQLNSTDSLDASLRLETLYLKVVNADGTSVIPFNVSRAPRNQWVKSVEGRSREMNLNYVTDDLPITGLTLTVAGATATALTYLTDPARANWVVRLATKVSGNADVEFGTISANPSAVRVFKIFDKNPTTGELVDVTQAEKAALETALGTMEIIGYDVYATRCNANLRTRGLLLNSVELTERYTVKLGAPLTIPSPVSSNREAGDLATLISAVRIRNSNNAVTTLFNHAEALSQLEQSVQNKLPTPAIEGIARFVLRSPFYHAETVNLLDHINSIKTHERIRDVQQALVNKIREISYRMYRDSGYQAALDAATGNSGEKPMVLIGTDSVLAKYLLVEGDTRTLGIGLDSQVVVSQDKRVYGRIFITLTRANQVGADPLSFGQFAWIPELASTVQVSRNGATTKEVMVQPRGLHIVNLPLLANLEITNLDKVVTKTIVYQTKEVV